MEYYHMTKDKYIRQIQKDGLCPINGDQSKSIGDEKKVVFYSEGKEGAIVMYLSFEKMYEDLKGERGDKALSRYRDYLDGKIELSDSDLSNLEDQVKQIEAIRSTGKFSEYYEDGPYFSIQNLAVEDIDDKNFNFANSWVTKGISPKNLQVMSLRNRQTGEVTASKFDVIKYMMSQTTPEAIADKGINDQLAEYIKRYYAENAEEITRLASNYEMGTMSIDEYVAILEDRRLQQGVKSISGQDIGKGVLEQIKDRKGMEEIDANLDAQRDVKEQESVAKGE